MRRKNCCLAAIMAAVLAMQTPMMANADYIAVYDKVDTGEFVVETNDNSKIESQDDEKREVVTSEGYTSTKEDQITDEESGEVYDMNAVTLSGRGNTLIVNGDVTADKDAGEGAGAVNFCGNLKIYGNVSAYSEEGEGIYAINGNVTVVEGSVYSENKEGIVADNSTVTVDGDVKSANSYGVEAHNNSFVTIGGSVSSEAGVSVDYDDNNNEIKYLKDAIYAEEYSTVIVEGNVNSKNDTAISSYASSVTVNGDVIAGDKDDYDEEYEEYVSNAVNASNGSTVNIGGKVYTVNATAVRVDNESMVTAGSVESENNVAADITGGSTLIVNGDITGGGEEQNAVFIEDNSRILVFGDVTYLDDERPSVVIKLTDSENKGDIVILGSLNQDSEACAIAIFSEDDLQGTTEEIAQAIKEALPTIIVGSMQSRSDGEWIDLWLGGDVDYDSLNKVTEDIMEDYILYYINDENINVEGEGITEYVAADGNKYKVAKEGTTVTVSAKDGYVISGLTANADGTYTITIPRGTGFSIDVIKKVISQISSITNVDESSDNSSDDESGSTSAVSTSSTASSRRATLSGAVDSSVLVVNNKSDMSKLISNINNAIAESTDTTEPAVVSVILNNVDTVPTEVISAIAGKNVILSVIIDSETLINIDGSNLTTADTADVRLVAGTAADGSKTLNVRSQNLDLQKNIAIFKYMGLDKVGSESVLNFVNTDGSLVEFRTSPIYPNGFGVFEIPLANANYKMTTK
jgi:hypothetical protein